MEIQTKQKCWISNLCVSVFLFMYPRLCFFHNHLYRRCFRFIVVLYAEVEMLTTQCKYAHTWTRSNDVVTHWSVLVLLLLWWCVKCIWNWYGFFYHWTIYLCTVHTFISSCSLQTQPKHSEKQKVCRLVRFNWTEQILSFVCRRVRCFSIASLRSIGKWLSMEFHIVSIFFLNFF